MSSYSRSSSTSKSTIKNKPLQGKMDHSVKSVDSFKYDKLQHKSDHLKYTHIIDNRINNKEDIAWQERIKQIMDLTRRSEDDVIMALHDSDGDLNRAVNDLLEGVSPEWEVKKKKARPSGVPKQICEQSGIADSSTEWEDKHCLHNDGPSRIRGQANHNSRGWRRRENKENEKNSEDIESGNNYGVSRRGRGVSGRSGRGGRGAGRGLGPRTFANRMESTSSSSHNFNRSIDTWTGNEEQINNCKETKIDSWNAIDASEDWDNEEYTGSLADTKVFTPSTLINDTASISESKAEELSNKNLHSSNILIHESPKLPMNDSEVLLQDQSCEKLVNSTSIHLTHSHEDANRGSLSAAQSEYFTQLTQQGNDCLNSASGQTTFLSMINNQPQRQLKHRPRVPPPSKIPSTAVEMPGDTLNSSISFLDVQFGALEFGSDANITEGSNQDKYNSSGINPVVSSIDSASITTKTVVNSLNSLTVEDPQASPSQQFSTTTKILRSDNQTCMHNEHSLNSQSGFTNRNTSSQSVDMQKTDLSIQASLSNSSFNTSVTYPSSKSSYPTSVTVTSYSAYSCNAQANQASFGCATTRCNTKSFSAIAPITETGYNSSYTQANISTYSQATPSSSNTTGIYNQTTTTGQVYHSDSGFTTTSISQYQSPSVSTSSSSNSSYMSTGYQNPSTFQPTTQTYQPSNTTFATSISQGSSVYSSTVQSVYSNTYPTYGCQNQTGSQDRKLNANKDLQLEGNTPSTSTSLVTTSCSLGLAPTTVNTSQTKTTVSNAAPKCTVSGLIPSSSSSSSSISGSTTGNIAPILSHQYIMGQSVPYATFQQPHMYSYEDLQLMQQRMPHMPTTGYYDATLGYQTSGPVTSLGNSRNETLSSVQGVQSVQAVQGQFTSINDARFTRTDSNASPVSSTMSQQTATQHQQPLMNPIPPGYAYFYGGGIMPAGGFQYGTPAIYPQIATAGSAGNTTAAYNTKSGSYNSGYGSGTNYDTLNSSGASGEYKSTASGYVNSQSVKNGSTSGSANTAGTSSDINATIYAKGHVALNKVNSYEKQTFHSATPPPFGLTNNQNANVISGYGTAHLFIPTVPHQLHQPLHQDGGNSTGQRTNTNSQNKAQVKSGYSTSYWAGGN